VSIAALGTPKQTKRPVYRCGQLEIDLGRREVRAQGSRVPIGGRAFDIMEILVEAAGELVSQKDLIARVWPGIHVEGNALQVHISALRKALGPNRALLKTASGRGYRLLGDWIAQPRDAVGTGTKIEPEASPSRSAPFRSNVPILASALIGRAAATRELQELLSAYRSVTLLGPGGIGKTALALEVARAVFPAFRGDVLVAELASLSGPNLVLSTVAGVLGLGSTLDDWSPEAIVRAVGEGRLLLVLDNCEHVIDVAAALAETLVRMCPHTTILATSREMLRIDGEYAYRVPPLDVPPDEQGGQDILACGAVQLFMARTRAAYPEFVADQDDLPAIAAICRRLDGVPLALEFAAARGATIGVQQVAARLDDRFQLLTQGRRRALPQHRTLRATLDWSYDLLSEPERRLLRHLSVFPGGFTLEGAAFVSDETITAVTDGVSNLVAKSLVGFDPSAPGRRWRLLETIRAYAYEKLVESGESGRAARRQAEFFRDFIGSDRPGSQAQRTAEDLARFLREIDNVRAALDWCFSPHGDAAVGIALTAGYVPVWIHYALFIEGREQTERALEALDADPNGESHPQLHASLGIALLGTLGTAEKSTTSLTKALAEAESRGDIDTQVEVLYFLLMALVNLSQSDRAVSVMEHFARLAASTGDTGTVIAATQQLGYGLHFKGLHAKAQRCCEQGLATFVAWREQKSGVWFHTAQPMFARAVLARILWVRGLVDQGIAQMQALLQEARETESLVLRWAVLRTAVCPLAIISGDLATAERALLMLADLARGQNPIWRIGTQFLEAKLLIARREFGRGIAILRDVLQTCDRTGWTTWYPEFLSDFAAGLEGAGQLEQALAAIERAQDVAERGGECWYLPEILRIKGGVLLRQHGDCGISAAEACFARAIDMAVQQTALSWELRTAVSLARMRAAQGCKREARAYLAPVYARFTEGFETADLRGAHDLLQALD